MKWKLKRTEQCSHCPWKVGSNPFQIPNGYDVEKHGALDKTISKSPYESIDRPIHAMACHESDTDYCIGWLVNQLGPGNNIGLRIRMLSCANARDIELRGEQHDTFEDTLP